MKGNEAQGRALSDEQKPAAKESPSEKLRDKTPIGSQVPGAQNPGSKEIKGEVNPNTE